jgi:hypothetical protein
MFKLFIIAYYISKMFGKITSGVFSGLKKFLTMERVIVLIVFLILMWALVMYANNKSSIVANFEGGNQEEGEPADVAAAADPAPAPKKNEGYSTKETVNPKELLPSDDNSQWAALNPNNTQDNLSADLLKAGQHVGVDTVGQSLRNANLQLRSDPIINKSDVGPWNQTTIEADYARVPLELGAGN